MLRILAFLFAALAGLPAASAAQLDGVWLPDTQVVHGKRLILNGIGVRTYSFLHIRIYVAGLYLEHPSTDPAMILRSNETKLLVFRFVHNVSPAQGRAAWREGFARNCQPPCRLDPVEEDQFLAAVPPIHSGDESTFLFDPRGVDIAFDGRWLGRVEDPAFARLILASFIGSAPPTAELKRQLLGIGERPKHAEAAQ